MYRSWVRAIPSDVYVIYTLRRNDASPMSEISNAVHFQIIDDSGQVKAIRRIYCNIVHITPYVACKQVVDKHAWILM